MSEILWFFLSYCMYLRYAYQIVMFSCIKIQFFLVNYHASRCNLKLSIAKYMKRYSVDMRAFFNNVHDCMDILVCRIMLRMTKAI